MFVKFGQTSCNTFLYNFCFYSMFTPNQHCITTHVHHKKNMRVNPARAFSDTKAQNIQSKVGLMLRKWCKQRPKIKIALSISIFLFPVVKIMCDCSKINCSPHMFCEGVITTLVLFYILRRFKTYSHTYHGLILCYNNCLFNYVL